MSKRAMIDHEQGTLELPWSNLSLKGVPTFRSITARGPVATLNVHLPNANSVDFVPFDNHVHDSSDSSYFFACPKCQAFRNISKCSMFVRSGWGHILCLTCKITTRSMTWNCMCNVPWHTCPGHAARFRQSEVELQEAPD